MARKTTKKSKTAVAEKVGAAVELTITNTSNCRRGIMLSQAGKTLFLEPGEIKVVPANLAEEVKALFNTPVFRMYMDMGLYKTSGIEIEDVSQLTEPTSVEAPAELAPVAAAGNSGIIAKAGADPRAKKMAGENSAPVTPAGYTTIGE